MKVNVRRSKNVFLESLWYILSFIDDPVKATIKTLVNVDFFDRFETAGQLLEAYIAFEKEERIESG